MIISTMMVSKFAKRIIMFSKSVKRIINNGFKMKVEGTKYLIFESMDHALDLFNLEMLAFDLINFCIYSEDNEEKQNEILLYMLAMEKYIQGCPLIKIKSCDDKFDFNTQDIDDFEDPLGIVFPTLDYYFLTTHIDILGNSDFTLPFYNNLKTEEIKDKFRDLVKAVDELIHILKQ